MNQAEQRKAANDFIERWADRGNEKQDSQSFWLDLLHNVYGIDNPTEYITFEDSVSNMMDSTSYIDGYIEKTHVLIEQKGKHRDLNKKIRQSDGTYLTPFQQALRYSATLPYSHRPRWIVTSNFKEFYIYDMENPTRDPEVLYLKDLAEDYYRLSFLVHQEDRNIEKMEEISIQAGEVVGTLYDALLKEYKDPEDEKTLEDLNTLSVRLVFCFYAEDSGLFGRHRMFYDYLKKYKDTDFRTALIQLFQVLDQKYEERDPYLKDDLAAFPYINGGLFEEDNIEIPRLNDDIIDIILNQASSSFDWSNISPTIFGGVFESTLNPETRRSGGMHYTSIENIHKVIDPLFINELKAELDQILLLKTQRIRERRLEEFQNKIASLKFLDPAAGSGNFLTETYISLRRLENEVIKNLYGSQVMLGLEGVVNPIKVSINQFYGIEINDFAVTVAKTALWIAESQMMQETEDIMHSNIDFLPIESDAKIVEGNALRINWHTVVDGRELNYIIGNPPFIGARLMDNEQKKDINNVFEGVKKVGNLDYVTAWFKKASDMTGSNNEIKVGLVATSSISQGQQVAILWKHLLEDQANEIDFAYRTFKWTNESKNTAAVFCVIIGFSNKSKKVNPKIIYNNDGSFEKAENINGYLVDADNVYIDSRRKPISNVPEIGIGNKPIDGGSYLFKKEEKDEFVNQEPESKKYFKKWYGAREFINQEPRYCLYVDGVRPSDLRKMPLVIERIENVKNYRLKSKSKGTRDIAHTPTKFHVTNISEGNYLLIPRVTSENRKYIPIGFMSSESLSSDAVQIMPNANKFHFGILTSSVHMAWMRAVAGRLEMRYRYSKNIVYNNFPWPEIDLQTKENIIKKADKVLKTRDSYTDWSYAELYDGLLMPKDLVDAHNDLDRSVMKAYGFNQSMEESKIVAELMKLYKKII